MEVYVFFLILQRKELPWIIFSSNRYLCILSDSPGKRYQGRLSFAAFSIYTPVLQYFSFLLDLDKGRLTKIMSFGRSLLMSFCSFCLSVFLTFEHAFLSKEYDFIVFLSRTTSCIDLVVLLEKVTFKCNRMCCNKTNIMSGEISSFTNLIGRNVRTVDCSRRFQMKMYWAKFTIGFLKTVLLLLIDILM